MSAFKIEEDLGRRERKLVSKIRMLESRLAGLKANKPEQEQALHPLHESEARFRTLFENMAQGVFYQMPDGQIRLANQATLDIFGLTSEQLQTRTSMNPEWKVIHEDGSDFPGETHPSWLALKTGEEVRNVTAGIFNPRKNDYVWVNINAIPEFHAGEDQPYQVFVTMHDITERKTAEAALQESEEKFRLLMQNCPDLVIVQNPEGLVTFISDQAEIVVGHPAHRFAGRGFPDIIHPEDLGRVRKKYLQIVQGGEEILDFEYRIIDGDGDVRWVSHTARQMLNKGTSGGIQSNIRNITEHKKAEETLRKFDERVRESLDKLMEGCQIVGFDWRFLYLNDSAARQGRKPKEEFLGRTMMEVLPGIEHTEMFARLRQCMEERTPQHMENEFAYFDGKKGWFELSIQPVREGIFIVSIDITERKRAVEALRLSEHRLELAHEAAGMGMFDWDIENDQAVCNERYFRLFGLEPQERMLSEEDWLAMVHPEDRERARREVSETVGHGAPYDTEYRIIRPDGAKRWVSSTAKTFHSIEGKPSRMIGTMTDITKRRDAEQLIVDNRAQLKSLASELVLAEEQERKRIAIHLHDDVCQNLAYSKMKLQVMQSMLSDRTQQDELAEVSETLTQMMQDVQTLTFELSSPVLTELGFEAAVSHWLTKQIEHKHDIATTLTDDGQPKPLKEDVRALLFRSLRELLTNTAKHSQAKTVRVDISREDNQIIVRLEDDGIGFCPEQVVVGKDAGGFGLFSIRERLSQMGGVLEIDSSPGQGCRSILRAPLRASSI